MTAAAPTIVTDSIKVNTEEAVKFINMCAYTKLVANLVGPPGCGKSAIVHQLAARHKLCLVDIRLAQCDPCDLSGFPKVDGRRGTYLPMDIFPLDDDPLPLIPGTKEHYKGFLIFFDEMSSAPLSVQAAAYKIILDRKVGTRNLHPNAVMVCAGNRAIDGAIVNRLSTAMQSRLIHLELQVEHKLWSLWGSANHLATEVISYINHQPDKLHVFDPAHNDKTFACPRTWEFASRLVKFQPTMPLIEKLPVLAGAISEGIAREFITYCKVYKHIPSYAQIRQAPDSIAITSEPSMLCALSGTVGSNVTIADLPKVIKYIYRLPIEFQVFALRDAVKRNVKMVNEQPIVDWITVNGDVLY